MASGTQRAGINVNSPNAPDYMWINHVLTGDSSIAPSTVTTAPFPTLLDSNGNPDSVEFATKTYTASAMRLPNSDQFPGPYVLTWDGDGSVSLVLGGVTWTQDPASINVTQSPNNKWTNTPGQKPRAIVSHSGHTGPTNTTVFTVAVTNSGAGSAKVRNVAFYRLADEADYLAGKVFRRTVKQQYVDYNPSVIRFMNWNGVNGGSDVVRWENRLRTTQAGFTGGNWLAGVRYSNDTVGVNQMTLVAEASTPASMQHGEVATVRVGSGIARSGAIKQITSISKNNPGRVGCVGHGFNTGDKVQLYMTASIIPTGGPAVGMTQLHMKVCAVTVVDVDTYDIDIDTTAFSTFTAGYAYAYISLQVGSGNDRIDYPVMTEYGVHPFARYGNNIQAGTYRSFVFNKNLVVNPDLPYPGAWVTQHATGTNIIAQSSFPVEFCAIFMNELNEMRPSGSDPIAMWVCIPDQGMLSIDPDYSAGSNYAVGVITALRATLNHVCQIFVEHSNETWNTAFSCSVLLRYQGYQKFPATLGSTDNATYQSYRAVQMQKDLEAAFPGDAQLIYVMGVHAAVGPAHTNNANRLSPSAAYQTISGGDTAAPASYFDAIAWAPYIVNAETNTNGLTSCVSDWVSAGKPTTGSTLDAIVARYVSGLKTSANGSTLTFDNFTNVLNPAFRTKVTTAPLNLRVFWYECAMEYLNAGGTDANAFMALVRASNSYAYASKAFYDGFATLGGECGVEFVFTNRNYGHAYPDTYKNSIEGGNFDQAWHALRLRNNGKSRLVVKN